MKNKNILKKLICLALTVILLVSLAPMTIPVFAIMQDIDDSKFVPQDIYTREQGIVTNMKTFDVVKKSNIKILTSNGYTVALKEDGTVWLWRWVNYGNHPNEPMTLHNAGLSDIVDISVSDASPVSLFPMLALSSDGTVWVIESEYQMWYNDVKFNKVESLPPIKKLSGTYLIDEEGSVYVLQLRSGYPDYYGLPPKKIENITNVTKTVGDLFLTSDGMVYRGARAMTYTPQSGVSEPINNVIDLIPYGVNPLSPVSGCYAIRSDGTVWSNGSNKFGELGNSRYSSTDRSDDGSFAQVEGLENIEKLFACSGFTFALKSDGTVWAWGKNDEGELGTGAESSKNTIRKNLPAQVIGLKDVVSIVATQTTSFALKSDGTVWVWGASSGTLTGSNEYSNIPIQISTLSDIVKIKCDFAVTSIGPTYIVHAINKNGNVYHYMRNKIDSIDSVIDVFSGQVHGGRNYTYYLTESGNLYFAYHYVNSSGFHAELAEVVGFLSSETYNTPTELTVQDAEVGVLLTWTGKDDADGYRIYRSEKEGEKGELIYESESKITQFVDVNVKSNTQYYYTIYKLTKNKSDGSITETTIKFDNGTDDNGSAVVTTGEIRGSDREGKKGFLLMKIDSPMMNVNGVEMEIDPGRGTAPKIVNDRTLMPIRATIEAMNGTVEWSAEEEKVSLSCRENVVEMIIGQKIFKVNGTNKELDVPPQIINDRTMLPIRFVAENVGCEIAWVGSTREVIVVYWG